MAIWTLDISYAPDENDFDQIVELDGVRFLLRFTWNSRDFDWRLSVYQPDGTPLALARRMVLNIPLLSGEIDKRLPPGWLVAYDSTGSETSAAHDELGARVLLVYFDADYLATGQ